MTTAKTKVLQLKLRNGKHHKALEARKDKEGISPTGSSQYLDFRLVATKIVSQSMLVALPTRFEILCYGRPRKLIQHPTN